MNTHKKNIRDAQDYVNCMMMLCAETPLELQYYTAKYLLGHRDARFEKKTAARLFDEHPKTSNNNLSDTLKNSFLINNSDRNWSFFDWAGRSQCPKYCSEIVRLSKEKATGGD